MWTDIAQGVGSLLSCVIAIIGFVFVIGQLRQVEKTIRKDALESLYGRVQEIHQVILNNPEMKPFFYDKKPMPEDEATLSRLAICAEMVLDFYELITYQKEFMPAHLFNSWQVYIKDLYSNSFALQEHLQKNGAWYSIEMRQFLLVE